MRYLLIVSILFCSIPSFAQKKKADPFIKDRPLPAHAVNDFGKLLTKAQKEHLENKINAYREATGYDIIIITVPTVTDTKTNTLYSAQEVAKLYFEKWSAGDTMRNNRLLLFREPNEVRVLTGPGIGALLTNADMDSVIEKMRPAYDAGLHFMLFKEGITAIQNTIENAVGRKKIEEIASVTNPPAAQPTVPATKKKDLTFGEAAVGLFFWFLIIYWLVARSRRKRDRALEMQNASPYVDIGGAWLTQPARIGHRNHHDD